MPDTATRPSRPFIGLEPARAAKPRNRLVPLVAGGALLGIGYAVADTILDDLSEHGGLVGTLYAVHEVIDHLIPIAAGVLLGVAYYFIRMRSELATSASESARDLRTRLQRVERDQAAWVVAASTLHEVRNPLHALGLLLDEVQAAPHEGVQRDEILVRARAQMDRIAEHLSKLRSLTGAGEPDIARLDLGAIVDDVARGYSAAAAADQVELRLSSDVDIHAMGDPTYVRIILDNLLRNGVEALRARGGGVLSIEVVCGGDDALVRVRDNGPGVPSDDHSGIFVPLRTTKEGGLGLGLSIGRALSRAMRGDLLLEESTPDGTTLCLHLPGAR